MPDDQAAPQGTEAALSAAGRWKIDPEGSRAEFAAKTFWGLVTVRGHFAELDGWLEVPPGALERAQGELKVEAVGLDTGNAKRDKHLRSADFFDVENHPAVTFTVSRIGDLGDDRVEIAGDLEVAGKSTPLEFEAKVSPDRSSLSIEGEASIDQRVFGMTWSPLGMLKNGAKLHVKATLEPA